MEIVRPVEFKPMEVVNAFQRKDLPPYTNVWFKVKGDTAVLDLALKQQIITYVSDYNILAAAMNRHASKAHWGNTQTESLDHTMWYFRDFELDDWLLSAIASHNVSNDSGFATGTVITSFG